jgi:hypothetical protein
MASKKQRRAQRRKASAQRKTEPSRIPLPKTRLKEIFSTLAEVARAGDTALASIESFDEPLVRFEASILLRGVNALKSVSLLLEQAHWETASAPVRQLFELLLNMEYLEQQPDRDAAVFRYAKFGLLQEARHAHQSLLYDRATGRPIDEARLQWIERLLQSAFPEFQKPKKDGSFRWATSWSDKNIRALADASPDPLRKAQYELLFTAWSEQTHGSPRVLLETLVPRSGAGVRAEIIQNDDVRVIETASMAAGLFLELWSKLHSITPVGASRRAAWLRQLMEVAQRHGAPAPAPPAQSLRPPPTGDDEPARSA